MSGKSPTPAETHQKIMRHELAQDTIGILLRKNRLAMRAPDRDEEQLEIERTRLLALKHDIDLGKPEAIEAVLKKP
jgi:hypothetical protein